MASDAYYDIDNWISLRYTPSSVRFSNLKQPKSFSVFDTVIWNPSANATRIPTCLPKFILCHASKQSVNFLVNLAMKSGWSHRPNVIFAGTDLHLSRFAGQLFDCRNLFGKIFFEAKNIDCAWAKSFSMGFNAFYLRNSGYRNIRQAVKQSDEQEKQNLILAAWGKQWKFLDKKISDRKEAQLFLRNCTWLRRRMVPFQAYWRILASHRYAIAPRGNGMQSPKLAEAWMVKTVPIVTPNPCFRDLHAMGFPMVFVNKWKQLSLEMLEAYEEQYAEIDWARVRYQLTNEFLAKLARTTRGSSSK